MLKGKDSQIDHLQHFNLQNRVIGNFNSKAFIYDLNTNYKNFFNNWIIVDSIDSVNGPSNWNLKKLKIENSKLSKLILLQSSNIIINSDTKASTQILLREKIISENTYFKFSFVSKVSGEVFVNFKYIDFDNYLQLRLFREKPNKGKISLVLYLQGKRSIIADLDCDKMISFLKQCSGFEINELNRIEIYSIKNKYVILFNDMIIFSASLSEILKDKGFNNNSIKLNNNNSNMAFISNDNFYSTKESWDICQNWVVSRVSVGLNNQKNFEIHELLIKNVDFEDLKKIQSETSDVKNYATIPRYDITSRGRYLLYFYFYFYFPALIYPF